MIKKIYTLIVLLLFVFPLSWTYALTDSQRGAILDNFKKKQYDLLFESDLWDFSNEFTDIFNISKKADVYKNIWESNKKQREEIEKKHLETLNKITSLQKSIDQLDNDIAKTLDNVTNINKRVIQIKREIDVNSNIIEILKKKIDENTQILLEYLIYIYKKGNSIYSQEKVDNLKSILLNDENISDLLNDLYFKWIIQVTWKKLIDNHKKYITDLYMNKVKLSKQESSLKTLRKMFILLQ